MVKPRDLSSWMQQMDPGQRERVSWSRDYAENPFGDDGHNAKLTIARMATLLDEREQTIKDLEEWAKNHDRDMGMIEPLVTRILAALKGDEERTTVRVEGERVTNATHTYPGVTFEAFYRDNVERIKTLTGVVDARLMPVQMRVFIGPLLFWLIGFSEVARVSNGQLVFDLDLFKHEEITLFPSASVSTSDLMAVAAGVSPLNEIWAQFVAIMHSARQSGIGTVIFIKQMGMPARTGPIEHPKRED